MERTVRARLSLQLFTMFCCATAWLSAKIVGLEVDYASFGFIFVLCAGLYLTALVCVRWRDPYVGPALEILASGLLLTLVALVTTYAAMAVGMPLADRQLASMDLALGFDWHGFIGFVDARPMLAEWLDQSYEAFSYQLLLVPILLCVLGRMPRACAFIIGYGAICLIASLVTIWYPALATFSVYEMAGTDLQNINAHFGFYFLKDFEAVRHDPDFVLSLGSSSGIVTFPSVHAAVGCLIIWAMWDHRWLRYPFLVINASMCVSAISHAGHYLVDIVAGAGVTGLSVAMALALTGAGMRRSPLAMASLQIAARMRRSPNGRLPALPAE